MLPAMNEASYQPRRSLIFTNGMRPELFAKALRSGADMVCVDLEDAIAPDHKDQARDFTLPLFNDDGAGDTVERMVRINSLRTAEGLADVLAVLASPTPPPALMLPKIKSPDEIRLLEELLDGRHSTIRFHVIIETNRGLEACHDIARSSPRIDSLLFGAFDMAADLRVEPRWDGRFSVTGCGKGRRVGSGAGRKRGGRSDRHGPGHGRNSPSCWQHRWGRLHAADRAAGKTGGRA